MFDEQDVRAIVERVVREQGLLTTRDADQLIARTIASTLTQLGVDTTEPIERQKDMAHAHKLRVAGEKLESISWKVVITAVVSGTIGLIWIGLEEKIKAILSTVTH